MDVNTANRKYGDGINGFTLMELMAVVAIIGTMLLLSFANNQAIFDQGREAAVKAFLLEVSSRQASFWQQHSAYAQTLAELNVDTPDSLKPYYKLELTQPASSQPGYEAKATPIGNKSLNKVLWVNHLGAHSSNWRF
ncbi:MAG: type IV pilin protein [Pseudomonadales bacterium]|nr:type IV pilin protein [Pseudomonadales bacterium]